MEAASYPIARALFEVTAIAHYVCCHLNEYMASRRYDRAVAFLYRASLGSYYMRERMQPREGIERPLPLNVGKAVARLAKTVPDAAAQYAFLSEFSHPDSFALMHYVEFPGDAGAEYRFRPYPAVNLNCLRETVGGTVALASVFYRNLFIMAAMQGEQRHLEAIMEMFLEAEGCRTRTGSVPNPPGTS